MTAPTAMATPVLMLANVLPASEHDDRGGCAADRRAAAFDVSFALLAARFDDPGILRRATDEVLERFRQGGSSLMLLWWSLR